MVEKIEGRNYCCPANNIDANGEEQTVSVRLWVRVPVPPGKSRIFFFKIPGPGKSWKLKFKVLESRRKIVATRCHILRLKCTKFDFGWGSTPDSTAGDHRSPS